MYVLETKQYLKKALFVNFEYTNNTYFKKLGNFNENLYSFVLTGKNYNHCVKFV